jgi:multiple sugar transport system permease protein
MQALSVPAGSGREGLPVTAVAPAVYVVGTIVAALFAGPLATVLMNSFKTPVETSVTPPTYLPHAWSLDNYAALATSSAGVGHSTGNSAIVAFGTVALTVVVSLLAGYGLSRLRFRGSAIVFTVILAAAMVPFQVIVTPVFIVLQSIGLASSRLGLILVVTTFQLPFAVFVMRNAFDSIPKEIWEASEMDGAGPLLGLWSMLPLLLPGVLTAGLFAFFSAWNDFFGALILLNDQSQFTLPVVLTSLISGARGSVNWGLLQSGVIVSILPCIVIFLLLQRYYVSGLMSGAVK